MILRFALLALYIASLTDNFCIALTCRSVFCCVILAIDALKTTMQVEGAKGLTVLRGRLAAGGPFVLYHGAIATYSATLVGQYVVHMRPI